ncbi:MAG: MFS transporter [Desulfomonilaceae bacterium]|nr:MFS transporter [Desulfomonilaceae bacterium]
MNATTDPAAGSIRRWAILGIAGLNFVISMFYRVSTAIISPDLVALGLTSSQLSDLAAAFYYAFAAAQIPVGIALDRLGARLTILALSFAAIGGAVLFAIGRTPNELILARVLLGIGMSGNFMVVLTLLAAWFPADRFASLSGVVVAVGALGNLMAATPLAALNILVGWRTSFLIFAAVNAAVVVAFLVIVRDHPSGRTPVGLRSRSLLSGLARVAGMYSYWAISVCSFVRYGYFAALQSLWSAPFLIYGLGFGEIAAGNAIFSLGLGYMVGLPLSGVVSDRVLRSRKTVVLFNMVAFAIITTGFIWWSRSVPMWWVLASFFLLGLTSAPGQILYAHMKELLPPTMVAQAMTSVNLFTILGVGVMTHVLGAVVGGDPSHLTCPEQFRMIWIVGVGSLAGVTLLYLPVADSTALKSR